jgi:hypothetical protein
MTSGPWPASLETTEFKAIPDKVRDIIKVPYETYLEVTAKGETGCEQSMYAIVFISAAVHSECIVSY